MVGLELAQHFVDQSAILDDEEVGIENACIFRADGFSDLLLHLENLRSRLDERVFETCDFFRDLCCFDLVSHHVVRLDREDVNWAARDPRSRGHTLTTLFLVAAIALHSGKNNRSVNYSSLKRDWINSSMSRIAWAASGPSARTRNFEPWPAASIIKPMMLFPLISSPSFATQISQRCRLAIRTNIAAGRACRPSRFTIVISFSTFSLVAGAERRFNNPITCFASSLNPATFR